MRGSLRIIEVRLMFQERMKKRGVSPLISAVLIIGFTISLAVIVFLWGSSFITERTQKSVEIAEAQGDCTLDVDFSVDSACVNNVLGGANIQIVVVNNKNSDISSFIARIEGDSGSDVVDALGVEGLKASSMKISGFDSGRVGNINSVTLIPNILVGRKEAACSDQKVKVVLAEC